MSSSYYKYFSAILLAFCLVFTINISQAFAQATGVQIVPKGINAAGEYVYTISGTIDENDYSSSLVWWNIVDYDVSVEVGGVQIAIYNIEGGLEEFDLTRGSNNSLAFTKDVVLNSPGIGEVKLISNRWTPNATMNQTSINFDTAQAQMDADAAAGAVPVVPVVPHAGVPIRPAPGSPSPSTPVVSPDCASWTSDADVAKCFAQWGSMASIFLIGVGVVGSVLLLPFVGYLLASGQPGNIEKGWEIFNSWFWGLMLLLLSGYIINIVGADLFGVS